MDKKPCVYIAMPTYDGTIQKDTAFSALLRRSERYSTVFYSQGPSSLLARTFNFEWILALASNENNESTHFAMIHGDIVPDRSQDWLDIMLREMEAQQCDVLSAVSPIKHVRKNGTLNSSTAVGSRKDLWAPKVIPIHEMERFPETFSIQNITQDPDAVLLVNTGLLLVKIGDWCKETEIDADGQRKLKVFFTIHDRVKVQVDPDSGRDVRIVETASEDWNFSRMVDKMGKKVMATTKVHLVHRGLFDYPNGTGVDR